MAVIILLDPLPAITDFFKSITPLEVSTRPRSTNSSLAAQSGENPIEMGLPLVPRVPRKFPRNKFDASIEDVNLLKEASTLISTANVVCIQQDATVSAWSAFRADPVLALLRVMQMDSKALFQSLEWALDEIHQDSLDGYLMSKRLEDWRGLMSDFEIEIPAMGRSLDEFIAFVFYDDNGSETPNEIKLIAEEVRLDIDRVQRRLVEAYGALRADMQFAESRRSITEAKTVTKLTELAFLFVPLSFTCSLFSMQITELSGGVPVWTFVVTALLVAMLAYMIRLVLTSDFYSRQLSQRFGGILVAQGCPQRRPRSGIDAHPTYMAGSVAKDRRKVFGESELFLASFSTRCGARSIHVDIHQDGRWL
nr:hypothetical protein CFP56_26072 [Quercus suber]